MFWTRATGKRACMLLLTALLGCDKTVETKPTAPSKAPVNAAATEPTSVQAAAVRQVSPAIVESELTALLASWTSAQNEGDFAAYQQLYAARFLGIKRSGERTSTFTREAWLKDRARMFAKPIKVEVSDVALRAGSESAEVSFTQRWASGNFQDVGPKRLLVVREGAALKIAHEEMLSSSLLAEEQAAAGTFDLHFTLALGSGLYMPLPEAKAPKPSGAVRAESEADPEMNGSVFTSSAPLDEAALDASTRSWKGQKVRLDDDCLASVDGFMLLTRVEPHFGTVQEWQGSGDPPAPALAPEQIARAAFALTEPVVVARLTGCRTGVFARREQTAAPVLATFVEEPALVPLARAAFAKLKVVADQQKQYLAQAEGPSGLWWEKSLKLQSFRHPISHQTLVSMMADTGGGCADFTAAEWALFELRNGKLVHLYSGLPPTSIEQVLDINGDGRLELIVREQTFDSDRALVSPDRGGPKTELRHSYQDCPC